MKVVVTGGAGFVGSKLIKALLKRGKLKETAITKLIAFDVAPPQIPLPKDPRLTFLTGDISNPQTMQKIIDKETGSIFHFAGVVSGQAEADLDLGMRVNIDGTHCLLDACRFHDIKPRFIFSSTIGVYGGILPSVVTDDTSLTPHTSYGMQKVCCEYIINDYTRRNLIDGRSVRLPTVIIRPGKPNPGVGQWTSSFFREPLTGLQAICPVSKQTRLVVLSIRHLVEDLIKVHDIPGERIGFNRTILLPALSVTVNEMQQALHRVGGDRATKLLVWKEDPFIQKIYNEWPQNIHSKKAEDLNIHADKTIDEIVQFFIEDDLDMQREFLKNAI